MRKTISVLQPMVKWLFYTTCRIFLSDNCGQIKSLAFFLVLWGNDITIPQEDRLVEILMSQ